MNVEIREFQPGDENAFRVLNEAWITAYFQLEDKDRAALNDPQYHILNHGGHIYFAVHAQTGEILGCCALLAMENGVFEVAKMAVAEEWRNRGVGRKLLRGTVDAARALGAKRLYLETNHMLENAVALYRSEGFEHLRPEDVKPSPYARATVFMEQYL
jgi:N-acetylglutamate synthase-like GNAT family acetyltransferase